MAILSTISGTIQDPSGTVWPFAAWKAEIVSLTGTPPVYTDGSPAVSTFGLASAAGVLSGYIPRTDEIYPQGSTLRITVTSLTSAPPQFVGIPQVTTPTFDLGDYISFRITAPSIPATELVYAYNANEITNPVNGCGYINTSFGAPVLFIFRNGAWIQAGPINIPTLTVGNLTVNSSLNVTGSANFASLDIGGVPIPAVIRGGGQMVDGQALITHPLTPASAAGNFFACYWGEMTDPGSLTIVGVDAGFGFYVKSSNPTDANQISWMFYIDSPAVSQHRRSKRAIKKPPTDGTTLLALRDTATKKLSEKQTKRVTEKPHPPADRRATKKAAVRTGKSKRR